LNNAKPNIDSHYKSIESIIRDKSLTETLYSYAIPLGVIDFSSLINNIQTSNEKYFFWAQPNNEFNLLGYGILKNIESDNTIEALQLSFHCNWDKFNIDFVPTVMGSLKFTDEKGNSIWSDYKNSEWFIPRFSFFTYKERSFLIINFSTKDDNADLITKLFNKAKLLLDSDHAAGENFSNPGIINHKNDDYLLWEKSINKALKRIDNRSIQKIVLSRKVIFKLSGKINLSLIIKNLKEKYPDCYTFAIASGKSIFFGATPEKLIKITGNCLETDALAGSIKRGKSSDEDKALADTLLKSKKNLAEQKAVVDFIVKAISLFSIDIIYDPNPRIKKLKNIQHLWTEIKSKLKPGISIFEIIKELHPTPAVCGVPCKEALKFISDNELHHRGLYSGIVGWYDLRNNGEFAVGIRSALIRDNYLHAFSGCGIVEGSSPIAEYEESQLKLEPILSLFKNEN